jgi:hypothetical protein
MKRFWNAPIKGLDFLDAPVKGRVLLKIGAVVLVSLLLGFCGLEIYFIVSRTPPKDKELVESFRVHRAAYERLREMLLEDRHVKAVYIGFGVETTSSGLSHRPPEDNVPASRYNEYVRLLKEADNKAVYRRFQEKNVEMICAFLWVAWPRQVLVCATDRRPENEVTSLDDYYRDPARPRSVFRHIDGSWYLWARY